MKKLVKYLILVVVVVIIIATFMFLWGDSHPEGVQYQLVTLQQQTIQDNKTATGNIEPRTLVKVMPKIGGIIAKIYKEPGDTVRVGDVIASIQVITDPTQLNTAESRLEVANIALTQITAEYQRLRQLYLDEVVSKNDFEQTEAAYLKAVEEKASAIAAIEILQKGVAERYASRASTQVRAETDGTIIEIPVREGDSAIFPNTFSPGTTIAVIADMNDLIFKGKIDETDVGKLHVGMPVEIVIGAIEDKSFPGVLEYIAPKGTREGGAVVYEVKAALNTPPAGTIIRADYSANARITVRQATNVWALPESVLAFEPNGDAYVWVFKRVEGNEQKFEYRQVKTGISDGTHVEITSGLDNKERVRGVAIASHQ